MTKNAAQKQAIRDLAAQRGIPYSEARRLILKDLESSKGVQVFYTIQQSPMTPSGSRPFPWHADQEGSLGQQDLWKGSPFRIIGFQKGEEQRLTMMWEDFLADPQRAIGLVPVMVDQNGGIAAYHGAISDVSESSGTISV